ncbi:unnamed protein product [Gulo gulo]|uniref:Uncharacterized protein n=1 Tax=Gulo gulo TaxID=48420 RepID=A0A9X9Q0J6_GULGU|nr:unnamed protein product [Gulo gulo]
MPQHPTGDRQSQHDKPPRVRSPECPSLQSHPQAPEQAEVQLRCLQNCQQGCLQGRVVPASPPSGPASLVSRTQSSLATKTPSTPAQGLTGRK